MKRLSRIQKDILMICYADGQKPVKSTHLPWMLKYVEYLRGRIRNAK